jgi:hypothetical protein
VTLDPGQKLAYSVDEIVEATPWSKSTVYELMASRRLPWRKQFGKRYVMREDLEALLLAAQPFTEEDGRAA